MVVHHRLVSSSNLELEEERDTSNGERRRRKQWLIDRTARTVAVLVLLFQLLLFLILLTPCVGPSPYNTRISEFVLICDLWIPGTRHNRTGRVLGFILMACSCLATPALILRQRDGSLLFAVWIIACVVNLVSLVLFVRNLFGTARLRDEDG